jgi:Fur family zinc uptake transcriptional regulator
MSRAHCQGCGTLLEAAERICRERGVRLTEQRRRVLEILCSSHRPMGAYDILAELGEEMPGAKPPTVYRALEFLQAQGLVHRLESLNAFVGCTHPEHPHASQFLICRDCGEVEELESKSLGQTLDQALERSGFEADSRVIEVTGRCARCTDHRQ